MKSFLCSLSLMAFVAACNDASNTSGSAELAAAPASASSIELPSDCKTRIADAVEALYSANAEGIQGSSPSVEVVSNRVTEIGLDVSVKVTDGNEDGESWTVEYHAWLSHYQGGECHIYKLEEVFPVGG